MTLFLTQGFCIGLNAPHGVSHGKMTSIFLKSRAQICRQANQFLYIINAFNSFPKTFAGGKESDSLKSLKHFPSPEIDLDIVSLHVKSHSRRYPNASRAAQERIIRLQAVTSKRVHVLDKSFVELFREQCFRRR